MLIFTFAWWFVLESPSCHIYWNLVWVNVHPSCIFMTIPITSVPTDVSQFNQYLSIYLIMKINTSFWMHLLVAIQLSFQLRYKFWTQFHILYPLHWLEGEVFRSCVFAFHSSKSESALAHFCWIFLKFEHLYPLGHLYYSFICLIIHLGQFYG